MECNKTGEWRKIHVTEQMPSLLMNEKEMKAPKKSCRCFQ
jgi:hypothetical protein